MADVRLEDIQSALSQWARQELALNDEVRVLKARIEELSLLLQHGIEQLQKSFDLAVNPNAQLHLVIDEALLSVTAASSERVRTLASQKDQIERLNAKVSGLEAEQQDSINRMVQALELPHNQHRTLRNATTEACEMIVEAKKMVQENL